LPRRSSSALVAISLAKAAVARIAGALSCGIQVLSSLHLAAVLVYTRKVGMVQDTADASALTLSSSVGLRILDGIPVLEEHMQGRELGQVGLDGSNVIIVLTAHKHIGRSAELSEDPAGITENFLLSLCMVSRVQPTPTHAQMK